MNMPSSYYRSANFGRPWKDGELVKFKVYSPSGRKVIGEFHVHVRRGWVKFRG